MNPIHIIPSGTDLRYTDVLANQAPWVFDLNQVLAGIEREKEGTQPLPCIFALLTDGKSRKKARYTGMAARGSLSK